MFLTALGFQAIHLFGQSWDISNYDNVPPEHIEKDIDMINHWNEVVNRYCFYLCRQLTLLRLKTNRIIGCFNLDLGKLKEKLIVIPSVALEQLTSFLISSSRNRAEAVIAQFRSIHKMLAVRTQDLAEFAEYIEFVQVQKLQTLQLM
jgi:hypothetical protein